MKATVRISCNKWLDRIVDKLQGAHAITMVLVQYIERRGRDSIERFLLARHSAHKRLHDFYLKHFSKKLWIRPQSKKLDLAAIVQPINLGLVQRTGMAIKSG